MAQWGQPTWTAGDHFAKLGVSLLHRFDAAAVALGVWLEPVPEALPANSRRRLRGCGRISPKEHPA